MTFSGPIRNLRVCRNAKFRHTLLSCVRVGKMQGAEIEDEGSVLTYMTKSEIEGQRSSLLIMTQRQYIGGTRVTFSCPVWNLCVHSPLVD